MSKFENKVDFELLISAVNANPNGDPLGGNRPRTDYEGYGEISDVCIKRKIRNRMQDLGNAVFVQSDDRCDDGKATLKDRAKELEKIKDQDEFARTACQKWLDVRAFGQVFAFKGFGCSSVGVRGPVSVRLAKSADPVSITSMQITKSVSGEKKDGQDRGSDTMGTRHFIGYGLYSVKGSINVQLAEKTGFTAEDAETVKECLRTLFVNDASSARPEGSMEVVKLYWWQHNCREGQYSSAKVHRLVEIKKKDGVAEPKSIDDYEISLNDLPGLSCEVIEGM